MFVESRFTTGLWYTLCCTNWQTEHCVLQLLGLAEQLAGQHWTPEDLTSSVVL